MADRHITKRVPQHDGWHSSTHLNGAPLFFFPGGGFDVCVWKGQYYGAKKQVWYEDTWIMSCHRQFGFSVALLEAKDERTAKLMALSEVQKHCHAAAQIAAKAIVETQAEWVKKEPELKPFRELPFGIPDKAPCLQCGASPSVPLTKLCGPCTFGDPTTANGNW